MNVLCDQVEQLIESSIHTLKKLGRNDEAGIKNASEKGEELIQIWKINLSRFPNEFREKIVNDLQSYIFDLNSSFFGFGNYAVIVVSVLQPCLDSNGMLRLLQSCFTKQNLDNISYLRLLDFILEILEAKDNDLKTCVFPLFVSPDAFLNFNRLTNNKIYAKLAQVYLQILSPQNILVIQQFYPIIVDKLKEEVAKIRDYSQRSSNEILLSERILNLLLSAIYPLCTLRNSFLIMALSPNLIDLCLRQLSTTELWFFQNYPILHRNILSIAFTFAKTHDFFVATCSWNRVQQFVGESPSSQFCQQQVIALNKLLSHPELLTSSTLDFLIDWLFALIGTFGTGIQNVNEREELISLRETILFLFFNEKMSIPTKIENIADNLKVFDVMPNFDEEQSRDFLNKLDTFLKSKKSLDNCHQVWKRISPMFMCKLFLCQNGKLDIHENGSNVKSLTIFDRASHIRTFLFPNNRTIFDQRFSRITDSHFSKLDWDSILKTFSAELSNGTTFLPSSSELCRTAIDELNKANNEAQTGYNRYYNPNVQNGWKKEREHLRVSCLLSLIEQLDKSTLINIYKKDLQKLNNHQSPRIIVEMGLDLNSLFTLFNFAYKAGNYELIVLFSTQFLSQFDSKNPLDSELLTFICWLIRAFVELKDEQSIRGLKMWIARTFNTHFVWMDSAELLAGGRFETALINLDQLSAENLNDRNIISETIFLLRERALRVLSEPSLCHQCAPNFYSQFTRPHGLPPIFNSDLLNSDIVLQLSSWSQFDRTPVAPPNYENTQSYNLFGSFDQIESNITSMHKIFSTFGAQSIQDVLSCLHESEKQIVNLSRNLPHFGICSSIGIRQFPLQIIIQSFRDLLFSTNTIDSEYLNEMLLKNKKWSTFTQIDVGQKIALWMEKLFGSNHSRFTELNSTLVKLSRKTGNLMMANNYLNKAPRGILNQTILKNNFGELNNLNEALKLEILRNDSSNTVGLLQKFFAATDLTASHFDVYFSQNPNLSQNSKPIVESCLKLAKVINLVPISSDLILNKTMKSNSSFWTQVSEKLNGYHANCKGAPFGRLLSGSFISVASKLSIDAPKAHKRLAEWALEQISTDINLDTDAIRLMPSEEVALQALCGLNHKNRGIFLHTLGQIDDLTDFQLHLQQNTPEFMNDSILLNGVQSRSFEQLWEALKRRQQIFYKLALESFIKFLQYDKNVNIADQISTALRVISLLSSHPTFFSQIETISNWIEETNITPWVKIVQQLFARLNHSDPFVRETLKALIEKIGKNYPHAICYPALIRSNSEENSPLTEICIEIIENLRSQQPNLISDLELVISEFQKITLLSAEKWLFVLNHLEQDVFRSCKQIDKEKAQLLEVSQLEEQINGFVKEAIKTIYQNALTIIEDLYNSTCEGTFETVERQRFTRNFKSLIQTSIKKAKLNFETQHPNFGVFKKLMNNLSTSISMHSQYKIKLSNLSPKLSSCTNISLPIPGQELTQFNDTNSLVKIQKVDSFILMLPTKTRPKKIKFVGSDGESYAFLAKGQEDLRVDEQISNLFDICNQLFSASKLTRSNPFLPYNIKSYTVTPIGLRSGLIQWIPEPISIYSLYRSWKTTKLNQCRNKRVALAEKNQNLSPTHLLKSPKPSDLDAFDELLSGGQERVDHIFDHDFMAQLSQMSLDLSPKAEDQKQPRLLRHQPDQTMETMERLKMSPIELFMSVLRSKLNEKNISIDTMKNRRQWPNDILESTFDELSSLVPSTLISDELWMKSENSADWWKKTRNFCRSSAISSMVGVLLGLGDRHLDNILLDSTGQVLNVDFNVCFNKGKLLRVPELVPFRLTRNIVQALGPTSIEGIFRCSAERTVEFLRSNNFVITTLLSSFIYDPLAEWIPISKQFPMGNMNIGVSMIVYEKDQRSKFAANTALKFLHLYLQIMMPKFKEIREELETALLETCQLFTEMNAYRLNVGAEELQFFNDRRGSTGNRLRNAIIAHQNIMRPMKPLFRILTRADYNFSTFMKTYRSMFSNPLVNGHRLLLNEHNIDYIGCIKNFQTALVNAESVYIQLADLSKISCLSEPDTIHNQALMSISCDDVSIVGSIFQDSQLNGNDKKMNETGVEIVNKCRLFLQGFDGSENNQMSVEEHVDKLIREATDKKLLCRMFEGWCSWI